MSPAEVSLYGEELAPGAVLGPYVVEELAHRGVHATLYRASHLASGRAAAVKVLRPPFAASGRLLRRFEQEGEALNRLRHPHIVEFLEQGALRDGRPFIALEWLPGKDLAAELEARGPLSLPEALRVAEEVGSALAAAHALGVVHRDLKAQNVVAVPTADGFFTAKLVDFGIAKLILPEGTPPSGLTSTGMIMGTPVAMAPEQIRGGSADQRTDVYAFGVLFYQLVTGQPPFRGASAVEVEEQHLRSPPPRASTIAPVPPEVDAVISRCLEKDPARRFPDLPAVIAALRGASGGARPAPAETAGVLLTAAFDPGTEAPDDSALDDLAQVLSLSRGALAESGMFLALESGDALLALAPSGDVAEARERALAAAAAIEARLASRPQPSPVLRAAVKVLVGAPEILRRLESWA